MILVLGFSLEKIPVTCELMMWNLRNQNRATASISPEVLNFAFNLGSIIAIHITKLHYLGPQCNTLPFLISKLLFISPMLYLFHRCWCYREYMKHSQSFRKNHHRFGQVRRSSVECNLIPYAVSDVIITVFLAPTALCKRYHSFHSFYSPIQPHPSIGYCARNY